MVDYVALYSAFPTVIGCLTLFTLLFVLFSKIHFEDDNGFLGDVVCYCFSKTIERDDNRDELKFLRKTRLPRRWVYWCFFAALLWMSLVFVFAWFAIWDLKKEQLCGDEAEAVLNPPSDNCYGRIVSAVGEIVLNGTQSRDDPSPDPTVCNGTSVAYCSSMVKHSHAGAILATMVGVMSFVDVQVYVAASCLKRIVITPSHGHWNRFKIVMNVVILLLEFIITVGLPILFPVISYISFDSKSDALTYVTSIGAKDVAKEFFIFFRWTETKEENIAVLACGIITGIWSLVTLIIMCCCAYDLASNPQPKPAPGRDNQPVPGAITNAAFQGIQPGSG